MTIKSENNSEKPERKPPVKSISLSFYSDKDNRLFDRYYTDSSLSFARGSLLLAIILYMAFAWLDPLIIPDVKFELMSVRIVSCLLFGLVIFITYTSWGNHHFQFLMSSLVILAAIGLIQMVMIAESANSYSYYAGLILAVMYAHTLLRIRFIYASITTWFVIFLYMIVIAVFGSTPFEVYMSNIFFLFSANLMGMFASYWLEYYMKVVYWKENLLQHKTEELQKEHSRKSGELEDARDMQLNMLPQQLPGCDKYMFSFSMKAASEVGGDYYDYHLDEFDNLTFGIGDATGHGLKASIIVTAMKLIFSEHAGKLNLVQFLRKASGSIRLMGFRHLYMAFAIGRLYADDKLELAGAGMPAALIYRYENRKFDEIPLKGMPLGTSVEYPYVKRETYIHPGDIVMLMSDGLAETFNHEKQMFGFERIKWILKEMADATPEEIIDSLHYHSKIWSNGIDQSDDMTFFIFKRNIPSLSIH
jgi:hypothetical protein